MGNLLDQAVAAHQRGDLAAAASSYARAIGVANHNLGLIAEQRGDFGAAVRCYRDALSADAARRETAGNLSLLLLAEGDYAEGWRLYEQRPANRADEKPHWPRWRGESLAGQRLAVIGEQGFGDQIQFARFLAPVRALGADVRLVCADAVMGLLGGRDTISRNEFDYWCPLLSLPFLLGVTLETLPPPVRLPVTWRGGGGVGVMVGGDPASPRYATKAPPFEHRPAMLAWGADLRPEATGAADFLQTAEIIAGLDLVITVDTAVAHLAGSMGAPTWVVLPWASDWRWMRDRPDSPWYPSVRLFRQSEPGDWASVLDAVGAALGR